ncbi:unnamed protein product [Boreogadus saida]
MDLFGSQTTDGRYLPWSFGIPSLQLLILSVKAILLHCGPGKSWEELSGPGNQMALVKDREASHCPAWDKGSITGSPLTAGR